MRIYTKKQAAKILAAMRAYLGAADAADLPEAVDDAGDLKQRAASTEPAAGGSPARDATAQDPLLAGEVP